jgi:hypothetical protein
VDHQAHAQQEDNMKYIAFKELDNSFNTFDFTYQGSFNGYLIGTMGSEGDAFFDYVKHNAIILDERLWRAGLFVAESNGYVKIAAGTNLEFAVMANSTSPKGKEAYTFTADDIEATTELMQLIMKQQVEARFDTHYQNINKKANDLESSTWSAQQREASEYINDNTISTPVLSILAEQRELTVEYIATKVVEKVNLYNSSIANLLAQQQVNIKIIEGGLTILDMNRINEQLFGVQIPSTQAEAEGISADRVIPVGIQI